MYFPSKAPVGVPKKTNRHHFYNYHQTSTGFMLPNIPYIKELRAGTKQPMQKSMFIRLEGMPHPVMGQAYAKVTDYFVPYRIIWQGWNNYTSHTINNNGAWVLTKPLLDVNWFSKLVSDRSNNTITNIPNLGDLVTDVDPYDFIYDGKRFKFTLFGQHVYTIIQQLGYSTFPYSNVTGFYKEKVNALPLLAFAKIMIDRVLPKDWEYNSLVINIKSLFDNKGQYTLTQSNICDIVNLMFKIPYEDDYFTTLWKYPSGPNVTPQNNASISIDDNTSGLVNRAIIQSGLSGSNGTAILRGNSNGTLTNGPANITQQDLNNLKSLDKWLKKNQIAGTKYWDQLLIHYGIATDKALITVPEIVDESKTYINFGEVMSQAETYDANNNSGANIGDYAGMGIINMEQPMNNTYFATEDGLYITMLTIIPIVGYSHRWDNNVLRTTLFEDWNEEFDGKGAEAVHTLEVYDGYDMARPLDSNNNPHQEVFTNNPAGFRPRYLMDKTFLNKCTGKYALNSMKNEFSSWNFTRMFNSLMANKNFNSGTGEWDITLPISESAVLGRTSQSTPFNQFNRIFYNGGYDESESVYYDFEQNFNVYMTFEGDWVNKMEKAYDYLDIVEEDEKEINVTINDNN